jgi:hypothetical protein
MPRLAHCIHKHKTRGALCSVEQNRIVEQSASNAAIAVNAAFSWRGPLLNMCLPGVRARVARVAACLRSVGEVGEGVAKTYILEAYTFG